MCLLLEESNSQTVGGLDTIQQHLFPVTSILTFLSNPARFDHKPAKCVKHLSICSLGFWLCLKLLHWLFPTKWTKAVSSISQFGFSACLLLPTFLWVTVLRPRMVLAHRRQHLWVKSPLSMHWASSDIVQNPFKCFFGTRSFSSVKV